MKNNITSKQACTIAHKIRHETGCSLADAFKAAYAGNSTVEPKTTWTRDDLDKVFSDKVAEILRKGYMIDTEHMGGHQGEIAKVLFKKDGKAYILVMESEDSFSDWYSSSVVIRFGKASDKDWGTILISKMETSWSMTFCKLSDNWFTTPELIKICNQKAHERHIATYNTTRVELGSEWNTAVLPIVRKQKGFKSTKLSDIDKVTRQFRKDGSRFYTVTLSKTDKYGSHISTVITF